MIQSLVVRAVPTFGGRAAVLTAARAVAGSDVPGAVLAAGNNRLGPSCREERRHGAAGEPQTPSSVGDETLALLSAQRPASAGTVLAATTTRDLCQTHACPHPPFFLASEA